MPLPPRRRFAASSIFVDRDPPKRVFEDAALGHSGQGLPRCASGMA